MSLMPSIPVLSRLPASGGALIASPSSDLREQIVHRLEGRCTPVQQAMGGADALAKLEKHSWQVLFLDRRLPDLDPEELRATVQRRFPQVPVVMLDSEPSHNGDEESPDDSTEINRTSSCSRAAKFPSQQAQSSASRMLQALLPSAS